MVGRSVAVGLLLAYIAVIAQSPATGLGDTSNHLARAYIMADLIFHHGEHFGSQFEYHPLAVPYIAPDLLLTAAVHGLGPRIAVASWTVLTFLSVPAALLLYYRVVFGTKDRALLKDEGALFLVFCASYLSTDLLFVLGFFAFQLGLACVVVILALIELLRRRWSNATFALYCGLVVTAYLIHVSTLLFLATIVAVSGGVRLWFRSSSLPHESLLFAPIVVILAWHLGVAEHYRRPTDLASEGYRWGTLPGKVMGSTRILHRYGGRLDQFLRFLYLACLLLLIRSRMSRDSLADRRVFESLALATAFFGMYFVLPTSYRAGYLDIRALAPAMLFLLLACLHLPRAEPVPKSSRRAAEVAVLLAFSLSVLNLAYLERHFAALSSWSMKYRALFAAIPRGAHVLPVYTRPDLFSYVDPSLIAVIDRQALMPYIFSADTGEPMTYFRYLDHPYAPPDSWYTKDPPPLVDWQRIACSYEYILASRPVDVQRIRIATATVAETSSAALLGIDPRACGAR